MDNFKPTKDKLLHLMFMVLISLSAGFLGGWLGNANRVQHGIIDSGASQQLVLNESQLISGIADDVGPSVVSVNVVSTRTRSDSFGFTRNFLQESAGTGFIISSDGVIITNRHVVPRGTTSVSVTLSDGTTLENVEVLDRTSDNDPLDIAFLKIKDAKGKELKPARLGDSSKAKVGDKVIAIGNALGQFHNTVTAGIISGYGRNIATFDEAGGETLQNLFQTDTAINQGNSGGPLVNIHGQVIAINTAVAGGAENIGFAIPINDVGGIIKSVLSQGRIIRPFLGVRYVALTDDIAFGYGLDVKRGAYVVPSEDSSQPSVVAGSPAEKAGVKEGDIIIKINDTVIDERHSLVSVLGQFGVGESVTLTIIRDDQEIKATAMLDKAPSD